MIQIDMEKPNHCLYCPMRNGDDECVLIQEIDTSWDWEEQYANCPLQEVEPECKKGKWTTEEVAEILFNAFGDDCACNFNGIDEWLPERCKYTEIADECPEPKEKHGCWMQFLLQGGGDVRGEQE